MKKQDKKILGLFLRYSTILLLGLGNLYIFYKLLTPITLHATNFLIKIATPTVLSGNTIFFNQTLIQIAPACVAGSAFYLLIILLFSVPARPKTRAYAIFSAIAALLFLNIARILILATLIKNPNFETIHWIFWHFVSTIFVVATYIVTIKIYKIKEVPFVSDLKYIKSLLKR